MKLNEFLKEATGLYLSGMCYYLRSAPGRGKTTTGRMAVPLISKALGKNLGFKLVNAVNLTPGDTIGYGVPKHENGRSQMVFTLPHFWKTDEGKFLDEYDGGIILIDEVDKADVDIKKVLGEMALSGECGDHRLPPGWVVWMAGNRAEDRSGSTKELDHLINRRFDINIDDDIEGWAEWCSQNDVHPYIIAFGKNHPEIVFPEKLPEKQGPFCTPRSLVQTGKALAAVGSNGNLRTDTFGLELACGGIGEPAAQQLFADLRLADELPSTEEIIASPDKAKVPSNPGAQMMVSYKLASITDEKTLAPVITYIERLPADFATTFAKSVIKRSPKLIVRPEMQAWTKRNSLILTIISMLK